MLKITGVKLEKNLDIDMRLFIEKGLNYIAKRDSKVNNKYMKNYESTKIVKTHIAP